MDKKPDDPLGENPVEGETVKVVDSDKWSPLKGERGTRITIDTDVTPPYDGEMEEKQEGEVIPPPWEEHQSYGRSQLVAEVVEAATHANKAESWASTLTALPEGVAADIKGIAEKLKRVVGKLV